MCYIFELYRFFRSVLQFFLECLALFCSVVQCICSMMQCVRDAVWCSVVQCGAVWCSVVQCFAVAVCVLIQEVSVHTHICLTLPFQKIGNMANNHIEFVTFR